MPDPILVVPGQALPPAEWEAIAQQHGGAPQGTAVPRPLPLSDPKVQALIAANPSRAAHFVTHPVYRYYFADGTYLEAFDAENGEDVEVVGYQPSPTFQQSPANKPETPATAATTPRTEGTPLPGGGFDNSKPIVVNRDPSGRQVGPARALTAQEREQWERETGQGVPTKRDSRVNPADATRIQEFDPRTGQWVDAGPNQAGVMAQQPKSARVPVPGHPGTYLVTVENPQTKQTESHYENEQRQTVPQPLDIKPGQVIKGGGLNGEDVQASADPVTGVLKYVPIEGAQVPVANRPTPAGAPRFVPDPSQGDYGLSAYNEQTLQAARAGVISPEQGQKMVADAIAHAKFVGEREQARRGQDISIRGQDVTQRGQTIDEVASRRSFQGAGFDTALREIGGNARYLGAGKGGLAADAFREALGLRAKYAHTAGGFRDVAPVGPVSGYLESVRAGTQIGVDPGGSVSVSPPGTLPPNAIGLGASGELPAPGGPAPSPPAAAGPAPPVRDDWRTNPGEAPEAGPAAYLDPVRASSATWTPDGVLERLRGQGLNDDELADAMRLAGVG